MSLFPVLSVIVLIVLLVYMCVPVEYSFDGHNFYTMYMGPSDVMRPTKMTFSFEFILRDMPSHQIQPLVTLTSDSMDMLSFYINRNTLYYSRTYLSDTKIFRSLNVAYDKTDATVSFDKRHRITIDVSYFEGVDQPSTEATITLDGKKFTVYHHGPVGFTIADVRIGYFTKSRYRIAAGGMIGSFRYNGWSRSLYESTE